MSNFVRTYYDVRTSFIFFYQLKKNASQSHQMLVEAYGGHVLSRAHCFRWFEKFKSSDFDLGNEERGKPTKKFEDTKLQALLDEDDGQMFKPLMVIATNNNFLV
uniref:Putative LOC101234914 [Hydra vulgaris] n=1 Tax=Lepeophtheirus salmonis TaxID=72036 RepID=A0A0K2T9Z7_LEPSM